jgi:hypothetical protein
MVAARDAVALERSPRAVVHRQPKRVACGRCGIDYELMLQATFAHEVAHHVLGHGRPADVAVAHKHYAMHRILLIRNGC